MSTPAARCGVIDIEASGFGRSSYPIEIGYVRPDGSAWCTLVQPALTWTHWDGEAERLHGITRPMLHEFGRRPIDVAVHLNQALAGLTLYCDGWAHDYAWLMTLYEEVDSAPSFRLESVRALFDDEMQLARLGEAQREARASLKLARHRASGDALALQHALEAVRSLPWGTHSA